MFTLLNALKTFNKHVSTFWTIKYEVSMTSSLINQVSIFGYKIRSLREAFQSIANIIADLELKYWLSLDIAHRPEL